VVRDLEDYVRCCVRGAIVVKARDLAKRGEPVMVDIETDEYEMYTFISKFLQDEFGSSYNAEV